MGRNRTLGMIRVFYFLIYGSKLRIEITIYVFCTFAATSSDQKKAVWVLSFPALHDVWPGPIPPPVLGASPLWRSLHWSHGERRRYIQHRTHTQKNMWKIKFCNIINAGRGRKKCSKYTCSTAGSAVCAQWHFLITFDFILILQT